MSTKSRILHGLYATGFGQIVTLLVQLAGVPLFLYFWGVEKYGEWLILSAIPAYLAMSDFGFASVAGNDMTVSVAQGRKDATVQTFQSTFVVILVAGAISGLAATAIVLVQMEVGIMPLALTGAREFAMVTAVFWGQVVIGLLAGLLGAGYRCDGNFAAGTFWANVIRLGEFLVTVACLLAGGGFVAVALSVLVMRFLGSGALAAGLRLRSPWLSIGIRRASRREIRRLIRPALAFMAFPVGNALSIQGFVLVVGWIAGGSGVALFSTYRTMSRFPFQMMGMVNASVWPELSRSFGAGDVKQARTLHRIAVSSSVWLVLVSEIAVLVLLEPILRIWTEDKSQSTGACSSFSPRWWWPTPFGLRVWSSRSRSIDTRGWL